MDDMNFITDTSHQPDIIIKNAVRSMLLATFLNQLLSYTATLLDSLIIGKYYGDIALGACGIVSNMVFFIVTVGAVFGVGSELVCSEALAVGDQKRADQAFSASLLLIGILSLVLTGAGLFFSGQLASLFGASDLSSELHTVTKSYIQGLAIGFPADFLMIFLSAILLLDGSKKRIMVSAFVMILVNVTADLFNVFYTDLGMFGIGAATALSNYMAVLVMVLHFAGSDHSLHFVKVNHLLRWLRNFLDWSLSSIFGRALKWIYYMILIRLILFMGSSNSLIAYSVFKSIKEIMTCICLGIGITVLLIANMMYAEINVRGLRQLAKTSLSYCLLLGIGIGIPVAVLAKPLISLYGIEAQAAEAVFLLRIFSLFFFIEFIKFYYSFYTKAIYKRGVSYFYNIFGELVLPLAAALILGNIFGIDGIWISLPAGSAVTVISVILYSLIQNGRCNKWFDNLLLLPQSFFEGQERCLNVSPENMEEAIACSETTRQFFSENGYSDRMANTVSLSIEELFVHIFERKKKDHIRNANLFVTIENDQAIIRIRHDGRLNNPLSIINDEVKTGQVYGPSLVHSITDRIEYNSALEINNILIIVKETVA